MRTAIDDAHGEGRRQSAQPLDGDGHERRLAALEVRRRRGELHGDVVELALLHDVAFGHFDVGDSDDVGGRFGDQLAR